jgi:hypothetical protein
MAQKDIESVLKESVAIPAQAIAADGTTNATAIDMQGYESVMFVPFVGTLTDGDFTPALLEGDDTNVANATAVADADLLPTGTGQEASAALDTSNTASKIGYRGTSRYVFCNLVAANVTTGGDAGVIAIQGHPAQAPVA